METNMHSIIKEIGIDAAHRVPLHNSKCRNIHGHRYTIYAEIAGDLFKEGPQSNMVLDFSFLKELLMAHIDATCDHGIILASDDYTFLKFAHGADIPISQPYSEWIMNVHRTIDERGFWSGATQYGKTYIIHGAPTAENLSQHWYKILYPEIVKITNGQATLIAITVKETPTSIATYKGE
jgi:6-pyruvoyltetrahydropterin/6-carboxytetrahydropterin synthase